jgi:hypothetical protein
MIPHPKKEVNQKTSVSLDEVSPMRRQEFHPSIQRGLTSKKEKEQNFLITQLPTRRGNTPLPC